MVLSRFPMTGNKKLPSIAHASPVLDINPNTPAATSSPFQL